MTCYLCVGRKSLVFMKTDLIFVWVVQIDLILVWDEMDFVVVWVVENDFISV